MVTQRERIVQILLPRQRMGKVSFDGDSSTTAVSLIAMPATNTDEELSLYCTNNLDAIEQGISSPKYPEKTTAPQHDGSNNVDGSCVVCLDDIGKFPRGLHQR